MKWFLNFLEVRNRCGHVLQLHIIQTITTFIGFFKYIFWSFKFF